MERKRKEEERNADGEVGMALLLRMFPSLRRGVHGAAWRECAGVVPLALSHGPGLALCLRQGIWPQAIDAFGATSV